MTNKMNVATATTTNSGKRNNSNTNTASQMNVENTKFEMANSESVEVGKPAAKYVVAGGQEVWRLVVNGVYYGCNKGSFDRTKLVIITNKKAGRNGAVVDYTQITAKDVIGYDDNYNPIYSFTCKTFHKGVKLDGDDESSVRCQYVDGPNGVSAHNVLKYDAIDKSIYWNKGVLYMDEDTYNEWGEMLNEYLDVYGIKVVMVGRDNIDGMVYDEIGNKIENVVNEDMTAVMTAYAIESGDDNNDTKNAIDYFTEKISNAQEEADVALTRKMICLRGNGMANDIERLKELDTDYSVALGRYYMYKKYVEILSKSNEIEELPF